MSSIVVGLLACSATALHGPRHATVPPRGPLHPALRRLPTGDRAHLRHRVPQYIDSQAHAWCNGSPKYPVHQGETLPGNTGMVANSLSTEVATHLNDIMIIPIYSAVAPAGSGGGANAEYTIVGFLAVRLVEVRLTGNPNDRGFKVEYVSYAATPGTFSSAAEDHGVYAINLVK